MFQCLRIAVLSTALFSNATAWSDDAKTRAVGNIGDFFKQETRPTAPRAASEAVSTDKKQQKVIPVSRSSRIDNTRR